MKPWLILALVFPSAAFAQGAPPPPDQQVRVPISLLQKLVDAGQEAPGKVINPLTDQVRQIINDQLNPKMAQGQTPPAQPTTPPGPQTPTTPPSSPPPETPQGVPPHHPLPPPVTEQK